MSKMFGSGSLQEGEEEDAGTSSRSQEGQGAVRPDGVQPGPEAAEHASGSGSGEDEEAEGSPRHGGAAGTCAGSSGQLSEVEQGQDDADMNSNHDSSNGNDSCGASSGTSSSAHRSPRSASGSGSTRSGPQERKQEHREMMETVQEMKKRLPSERKSRSKPSTVEALNYALNCVKQVQANSEYYKLLMNNGLVERKEAMVCPLEELESITSEHTLKNTDTFAVVFSLRTGRVLFASEQAPSILNCKRKFLRSAKFVELLYHQDVNVFYSQTAQPHLPPWNVCSDSAAILLQYAQVKSFFCRIRGGKNLDGEMRYNPFRFTPYLLKVRSSEVEEEHPCCLALAERIISGYEAPRIPPDKRIFTTTHSPGCVFLEVDDRAVPLLGYLPQDLIGTSMLTCLHPEDRTLMLAMHRKILKYAGQPPFEHSPIRLRCQNGDYVTLDTSWSSFINPWSRKVAFIIGRHNVRTGPLNEDVFAAQTKGEGPVVFEEVKELQAQIYKLLLQPVRNNGSSGYGSLGSNGSHEPYISVASSSDSNGNLWEDSHREPMALQRMSVDVHRLKSLRQQACPDSRRKLPPFGKPAGGPTAPLPPYAQSAEVRGRQGQTHEESPKQSHIPSYQQINCVNSIIRYLESCTVPALKRNSKSLSISPSSSSSASEEDKTPADRHGNCVNTEDMTLAPPAAPDSQVSAASAAAVVGAPLTDITLSSIAMSVVSVTSQCSYSSTIVHVPQPESEVTALEDAPMGSEQADPAPPLTPRPPEELRVVGLTKEVLSAHTQKEEQEYVDRFRHRILQSPYSSYLQQDNSSLTHSHQQGEYTSKPVSAHGDRHKSVTGRPRHKRLKPQGSSDSYASPPGGNFRPPRQPPQAPDSSWPPSESSQPQPASSLAPPLFIPFQAPYFNAPGQVWGYTMGSAPQSNAWSQQGGALFHVQPDQITQPMQNMQPVQPMQPTQSMQPAHLTQNTHPVQLMQSMQPAHLTQNTHPVQPMQSMQPLQPMQSLQPVQPMQNMQPVQPMQNMQPVQPMQNMQPVQPMQSMQPVQLMQSMQPAHLTQNTQPVQPMQSMQPVQPMQSVQPMQNMQPVQPMQPLHTIPPLQNIQPMQPMQNMQTLQLMQPLPPMQPCMAPVMALILPNYPVYPNYPLYPQDMTPGAAPPVPPQPFGPTPDHAGLAPQPQAPPFMASSNPPSSLGEEAVAAQPTALFSSSRSSSPLQLNLLQEELPRCGTGPESLTEPPHVTGDDAASDSGNHDNQSTSSKLLDLMIQADACSGTGSNASGSRSGESGESLGSGSGSGSNGTSTSHTGSSNTSKYFASNDSSDSSRKARKSQEVSAPDRAGLAPRMEDSPWTFLQPTPEPILMTYQIRPRDHTQVLQQDWEKLIQVQSQQPCFSQQQMEELAQVHPWIKQRSLPREIDTQGCVDCCTGTNDPSPRPQTPDSSCPFGSPPDDPAQPSDT